MSPIEQVDEFLGENRETINLRIKGSLSLGKIMKISIRNIVMQPMVDKKKSLVGGLK